MEMLLTLTHAATAAVAADHHQVAIATSMRVQGVASPRSRILQPALPIAVREKRRAQALSTADWKPVDPGWQSSFRLAEVPVWNAGDAKIVRFSIFLYIFIPVT